MFVRLLSMLGAVAATAATLACATPASAQDEVRSTIVSLAGLDLSKPADAARLNRRLRTAAHEVCYQEAGGDLRVRQQIIECEKEAMMRANADVQLALRGGGSAKVALTTR